MQRGPCRNLNPAAQFRLEIRNQSAREKRRAGVGEFAQVAELTPETWDKMDACT